MRIVLVKPGHPGVRPEDEEEHLGLGYIAAVARRDGHEVRILDTTLLRLPAPRLVKEILLDPDTDLVGLSVMFQEVIPEAMAIVAKLRRSGFTGHIVLGGHPPTFLYRQLISDYGGFDTVVIGEGEETFAELLQALGSSRVPTLLPGLVTVTAPPGIPGPGASPAPRPLMTDLDALPFPARDTLQEFLKRSPGPRRASLLRSRGCYGDCSFCDTRAFYAVSPGPVWRVRSTASVANEAEMLISDHGISSLRFWDDNFMGPGRRGREAAEELAREFLRRGFRLPFSFECRATDLEPDLFRLLKEAGLSRVFLGIESASQRQLDTYNKMVTVEDNRRALALLEELGIQVSIGMIMFDPDTTVDELNANLEFLRRAFGSWAKVKERVARPWNRLEVYAGTPIEKILREQGRLKGDYIHYDYEFSDPTVRKLYGSGSFLRRLGLPIRDAVHRLRRRA
jgi:radical SAM superfamily enzyme YgiQ (UPF0313 family)